MPARRHVLRSVAALGALTVPGTVTAHTDRPNADVDAALSAFGSGAVDGRVTPPALARLDDAVATVSAEAPAVAERVAGRLPSMPGTTGAASDGSALGALADADLRVRTVGPGIDGVTALTVGIDFAARGPVVRARVTGTDGAPARRDALDALAAAGLPVAALEPFAVPDGDDLALYADVAARDDEQSVVLALLLVVLAAVVGTFVLGLGSSVSGSASGGGSSGAAQPAPQVSFSFEYSADTRTVSITHDGGDRVDAAELQVAYTSDGRTTVDQWREEDGVVTAGDRFTTSQPVDSGATLRVIWQSSDGNGGAVLGTFEGP